MTFAPRGALVKIKDETNYYTHQVEGVRDLYVRGSALLADEMGLGKSLQALTVAACDFEVRGAKKLLIVCPASLKWNWAAEIERHTNFTCMVLSNGSPIKRTKELDDFDVLPIDVLIVNYEQVVAHLSHLNEIGFQVVIYDEAHYIKGHKSKRTKACLALNAQRHLLLTGSPMLNHVDDLWSLLHRIDPEAYPSYWSFLNRYAVFGGYKDKQLVGIKNPDELNARLQAVMLRRLKKDVLDLPDKMYNTILVDLHPEQRKLYDEANDELRITLGDISDPMELENALVKMLRLKQICGTTATIPGYEDHSIKLDVAVERCVELAENDKKVVVFTQFRDVQKAFLDRIAKVGLGSYELHGDVPVKDRQIRVDAWSSDCAENGVMSAMLQVAGVGLTMTAARTCIFLDKLWSPKLNEQAEDRLHRIGASTTEPVEVISIMCKGTVEQRVETIIKRKKKTFDTIVEEDDWKRRLAEELADDYEGAIAA